MRVQVLLSERKDVLEIIVSELFFLIRKSTGCSTLDDVVIVLERENIWTRRQIYLK